MAKTKTKEKKPTEADQLREELAAVREELAIAQQGKDILQSCLDWCGEFKVRISWFDGPRKKKQLLNLRVKDIQIELEYTDPISGLLEAVDQMKERLARRRINQGV